MSRFSIIIAALVGASLALLPLHPVEAATEKKSTASSKKKSTTSTAKKKPTTTAANTSAVATDKTPGTPPLELPLPAKVPSAGEAKAPTDAKAAADETASSPAKEKTTTDAKPERAPNATVEPDNIAEFSAQPPRVQQLIRDAIDLTRLNLTYTFGSADPDQGGMDCSGTMYYLLRAHGFDDVARDSAGQYLWARKRASFFPVVSTSAESVEFEDLQPGDLMFWTGTYQTGRDVPISHVMLYLGREKTTKKRIMFGASDGRSYNGIQRWGVSVFDFKMPKSDPANPEKARVDFVGFARIPGLRDSEPVKIAETAVAKDPPEVKKKPAVTSTAKKKTTTQKSK